MRQLCRASSSVCSCHLSHTLGDSGVLDILCGLHEDWRIPMAPTATNPSFPQEAPVLLPCLIMWARCLGVSLCQPVALSASIMPLYGRPHSLFLCVCVRALVCGWFSHPQTFPSTDGFIAEKQGSGYNCLSAVHTNVQLKCLHYQMGTGLHGYLSTTHTFTYVSLKYMTTAEGKI